MVRQLFLQTHRQLYIWSDEWLPLTLEEATALHNVIENTHTPKDMIDGALPSEIDHLFVRSKL